MAVKRALFSGTATPAKNAKRLRILAAQVRRNTGELKRKAFTAPSTQTLTAGTNANVDLSAITQGDAVAERIGVAVRVKGIEVRISCTNNDLDAYLVLSPQAITPTGGVFHSIIDGHITTAAKDEHKELHFFKNYSGGTHTYCNRRFKTGIPVLYSSSNCIRNKLSLFFKNSSAVSINYVYSVIVYYTDS